MEINKEREAFEEHLAGMNIHNLRVGTIFDIEKNEYFASDVLHPSEDHIVGWINFSWKLWQEKATPEGFVLVPKEKIESLVDGLNSAFQSDPTLTLGDLLPLQQDFQAMIEAREQSHD